MKTKNKYCCWHDQLIDRARTRGKIGDSERHHIIPRCLGGNNDRNNLVYLTYREHFLIHWLLARMAIGKDRIKMFYALAYMLEPWRGSPKIPVPWQHKVVKKYRRLAQDLFWADPENRARRSASAKAMGSTLEVRSKLSAASKAVWADPEYRSRMLIAVKAAWADPEKRAQMSTAIKEGYTPEAKAKQSVAAKAAWANPEKRAQMSAAIKTAYSTPEARARMSMAAKIAQMNPEVKVKHSAAVKAALATPEAKANMSLAQRTRQLKRRAAL